MSYWSYGLVREDGKKLMLAEIHFNKNNKPWGYSSIWPNRYQFFTESWWLFISIPSIIKDIRSQLKHSHIFHSDDIKMEKADWHKSFLKDLKELKKKK